MTCSLVKKLPPFELSSKGDMIVLLMIYERKTHCEYVVCIFLKRKGIRWILKKTLNII
jgi:hypothetical protein